MSLCSLPHFPPISPCIQEKSERRDAITHRAHIVSVARDLFNRHGVDKVSMHQIAVSAKVGQGTLYRHFAHKGILCDALLNEDITRFQQSLLSYFETTGIIIPVLEQLRYFLRQVAIFTEEQASLLNAVRESCGIHHSFASAIPHYVWLHQVAVVLLQRAIACQEIAPLDVEYTAFAIMAPLSVDLYCCQRHDLGYDRERILSGLEHLLFHGLRPGS